MFPAGDDHFAIRGQIAADMLTPLASPEGKISSVFLEITFGVQSMGKISDPSGFKGGLIERAVKQLPGSLDLLLSFSGAIHVDALEGGRMLESEMSHVDLEFLPVEGVTLLGELELAKGQLEVKLFVIRGFVAFEWLGRSRPGSTGRWQVGGPRGPASVRRRRQEGRNLRPSIGGLDWIDSPWPQQYRGRERFAGSA